MSPAAGPEPGPLAAAGAGAGDTLFIADLHLDAVRPGVAALAQRFVERLHGAAALWILGDLFEAWLGDDLVEPAHEPFIAALGALATSGTAVHLMHGNRDFLLGEAFAARIGAVLHREDERLVALGGESVLLLHGDTLCTDDRPYQELRATLRDPCWQAGFLARTPAERIEAARALRERSREAVAGKSGEIMDVAPAAVEDAFVRSGCGTMIHGHTHRPDDHRENSRRRRLVLGDWHADHARYARHDGSTFTLETWLQGPSSIIESTLPVP